MFRQDDFKGLNETQIELLKTYYFDNKKKLYTHRSEFKGYYFNDSLMIEINKLFDPYKNEHYEELVLEFIEINSKKFILLKKYNAISLFDTESNETYTYMLIHWKTTGIKFWANTNSGYLTLSSGEQLFRWYKSDSLELLWMLPEFKYINFSKIKYGNPYVLLNERLNKQKLWQIEMLIKQGYIKLAEELCSSYATIDFKIFRNYLDFFKKQGKGLSEYNQIIHLIKEGFSDPEFMYLDRYLTGVFTSNWFVKFLKKHSEMNQNRFLKYIRFRKGTKTKFGTNFLSLYKKYLEEIEDLNLDLKKDKYAFPEDLIKAMEDHLLSINPYEYKWGRFRDEFEYWQSRLQSNEQSDLYVSRIKQIENEAKARAIAAKKRTEERERFLKFLWSYNKNIKFEINDLYVLTAPQSSEDLLIEGKVLNHCVGSYVDRIAKRETSIYFLRKKDFIDKPFYTIEIKNGIIQQCRTTNNQVNEEVLNTIKDWLDHNITKVPSWDLESEIHYGQN